MKRMPALVAKRLGKKRAVRVQDVWWCVRFMGRTYRGLTPVALLTALPKRGRQTPAARPPELPLGGA